MLWAMFEIGRGQFVNGHLNLKWATKISTSIVKNFTNWLPKFELWDTKHKF